MAANYKVVVDCSAPDKERQLPLIAAAIEGIMDAARSGTLSLEAAKTRSEELVMLAVEITEAPDQVQILPLTEEDLAQRELDTAAGVELAWSQLRVARNARLAASDWTQLPDSGLDDVALAAWTSYRQELRDLPTRTADPFNPDWPVPPG